MAMDLMTEAGRAEAERLARELPTGARVSGYYGDEPPGEDEDEDPEEFLARYDLAVARVVTAQAAWALLKVQTKGAKEEVELALFALQRLRKTRVAETEADEDEPRQLPLART